MPFNLLYSNLDLLTYFSFLDKTSEIEQDLMEGS